jgi:hypothetical protein
VFTNAMGANKIDAVVFPVMAQLPAINGDRNTQLVTEPKPGADAGRTAPGSSLTFVGSALQWSALSVPAGYLGEGLPQGCSFSAVPGTRPRSSGMRMLTNRRLSIADLRPPCRPCRSLL